MSDSVNIEVSTSPCRKFVGRDFGPVFGDINLIRKFIDKTDDEIRRLLHDRSIAVLAATCHKPTREAIAQPERQQAVIGMARERAEQLRSPLEGFPELVEDIYRVVVSGFVALQELAWEQTVPADIM